MHIRNRYANNMPNFAEVAAEHPPLSQYLKKTRAGHVSIDFKNPRALRELTYGLLWKDFGIRLEIPLDSLCPPIPNRLDYLLSLQDMLLLLPRKESLPVHGIDIGTGASCIYPLLGCCIAEYWHFTALEIDDRSIEYARENVERNNLQDRICILKNSGSELLPPNLLTRDSYDFCMCNPPFYEDAVAVAKGVEAKALLPRAVCTGSRNEMITDGGEYAFVARLFEESCKLRGRISMYSSLIGRKKDGTALLKLLEASKDVSFVRLVAFRQGTTRRWILFWSFVVPNGQPSQLDADPQSQLAAPDTASSDAVPSS
ncbi:ribosomal RNA large subunit methyltransferase F-like protein [Polychytrium aggregatum]|uniref:ribosomal RNA large subunit methyltransferase F-like protein n=1 Tax=Polychytrium aggregatum TaxID=110093 RepID=UPI0022FDFAF4|nr:ribosomal RNA large subunit methyltransferase F-like protein [Polychytrium aggregatum]KAI9209710.1 ribosomal RNA large subunit methyltransferase F-like protein [Polychytrium aggregatum]